MNAEAFTSIKVQYVIWLIVLTGFSLPGCSEKDNPADPYDDPVPNSIQLSSEKQEIVGYAFQTVTSRLTAFVADENGDGIENVTVSFIILSGPGQIVEKDTITDSSGLMSEEYLYYFETDSPDTVKIRAELEREGLSSEIAIPIRELALSMEFKYEQDQINVPVNSYAGTKCFLDLADIDGNRPCFPIELSQIEPSYMNFGPWATTCDTFEVGMNWDEMDSSVVDVSIPYSIGRVADTLNLKFYRE